jgi:hypothetical protein
MVRPSRAAPAPVDGAQVATRGTRRPGSGSGRSERGGPRAGRCDRRRCARERTRPRAWRANDPRSRRGPEAPPAAPFHPPGELACPRSRRRASLATPRVHRSSEGDVDNSLRWSAGGVYGPRPSVGDLRVRSGATPSGAAHRPLPKLRRTFPPRPGTRPRDTGALHFPHLWTLLWTAVAVGGQRPTRGVPGRSPAAQSGPPSTGDVRSTVWQALRPSISRSSGTTASTR